MRLIDADELKTDFPCGESVRTECVRATIDHILTIQPEPESNCSEIPNNWIPCSERLPESYVDVLVWFEYYRYGNYNRLYQTHGIGTYSESYDSWTINHESGWHKLRVIAWQPLPSPYQPEEESE